MTKPPQPTHLGDGAYISIGRYVGEVIITAGHHDPERASNRVYLDSNAIRPLQRWLEERAAWLADKARDE